MAGKGEAGRVRKQGKEVCWVDWPLQWTGSCKGRVPAVDGFLQWTGFCSGQAPAADWSLWRPVKVELIIHPRRFGKTLNMTMLRDFLILWRKAVLLIDEIQLAGYNQPVTISRIQSAMNMDTMSGREHFSPIIMGAQ